MKSTHDMYFFVRARYPDDPSDQNSLKLTATNLISETKDLVADLRRLPLQHEQLEEMRRLANDIFTHLCIACESTTPPKQQCTSKL